MYLCSGQSTGLSSRVCRDGKSEACVDRAGVRWRPLPGSMRIVRYAMHWQATCMPISSDHRYAGRGVENPPLDRRPRADVAPSRHHGATEGWLVSSRPPSTTVFGADRWGGVNTLIIFFATVSFLMRCHDAKNGADVAPSRHYGAREGRKHHSLARTPPG